MIRVGSSIDIHKFAPDRKLMLCGIEIDYEYGLDGHSDADVGLHAICEAIIGALGLGDIGEHFPDTDPKYKGISSILLLAATKELMEKAGYKVGNLDLSLLCEKPHLKTYKQAMKNKVAEILEINSSLVNIKATRGEGLGFIGRKEGIVAMCTILIIKESK